MASLSTFAILTQFNLVANAADWPQFQGPMRNGTSEETVSATSWGEGGPRTVWSLVLGEGFGGAAVRDGEVYLLDRVDNAQDVLRCLTLETGEEIWNYPYDAPGEVSHNGSRSTPTVTEKYIYTVGMMGHLYCIDRESHEAVWHRELPKDFPPMGNPKWGYSQAPFVHGNLVIVAPQSREGFVVAFDRLTGDVVWKTGRLGSPGYSSPIVTELAGVEQVVMVNAGKPGVSGLSLEDGSVLWSYDEWTCRIPIPFATPLPGNRLFITGEYGAGSAMLEIERNGEAFQVNELYTTQECGSQIHQPLLHDGYLYMNSNGNNRNDGMLCLSLDGEMMWRTRGNRDLPRFERGGLLMAGNRIVNFDGKRGTLHLIEPSPEGYREVASAQILEGQRMWSPMALSRGKLLVRNQEEMICIDLGGA